MYVFLVLLFFLSKIFAKDPPFGQLKVSGKYLTDQDGNPIQLRGMSLFWSQWEEGSGFYNHETVKNVKKYWNSNVIRAALAVEYGGYSKHPEKEYKKVKRVIDACIEEGIYVIIDWHSYRGDKYKDKAIHFFKNVSKIYSGVPNVIYEIWNEPNDDSDVTWDLIKSYAYDLIDVIRENDPNNVIVVGTPFWDQNVDEAADDPIARPNIAYTLHYYAASHKQELRDKAQKAINKGLPIFITEYGTVNYDGDGDTNAKESKKWWDFADRNKLSYVNWSMEMKDEGCAALKPGSTPDDIPDKSKWTKSGKLVNKKLWSTDQGLKQRRKGQHSHGHT